jgi:hypothetical protein
VFVFLERFDCQSSQTEKTTHLSAMPFLVHEPSYQYSVSPALRALFSDATRRDFLNSRHATSAFTDAKR